MVILLSAKRALDFLLLGQRTCSTERVCSVDNCSCFGPPTSLPTSPAQHNSQQCLTPTGALV